MSRRAVFLDRDGVINSYVYNPEFGIVDSPANPSEFKLLPGVGEAIAELNRLGFLVIVVSNQPGVAKNRFTKELLEATTAEMENTVRAGGGHIDAVYYCMHHPEAQSQEYHSPCSCRKPAPGLLLQAAKEWDIDLRRSYMVGDGIPDIVAGEAAGTQTVFIAPRKGYIADELFRQNVNPHYTADSLPAAAELIRSLEAISQSTESASETNSERKQDTYTTQYVKEAIDILERLHLTDVESMVDLLVGLRRRAGRLFLLGVGGGAGHASHAVCDFRKICGIEAYAPSDNVSELTARINDDGWETSYANWLRGSRLSSLDMVLVFSVGGGDAQRNVSANLVRALQYAKKVGASICGVVGRDGGFTAQVADACVLIPVNNPASVTPHTEAFQALVWHLVVSHPRLKAFEMKWESVQCTPDVLSGPTAAD